MAQYVDTPTKTFIAGGALDQHLRVKLSSGKLAAAGVADDWIGTTVTEAFADGDAVAVRLRGAPTSKYIAAGAITTGARVYAAASGKVDDTVTTELIGIALPLNSESSTTAAGANNDICEVLNIPGMSGGRRTVSGEVTLDGSNPTPVTTGLNTITSAQVTLKSASAPADDPSWVSCDYSGSDGTLNVYAWKNTGGTDPTLVASTNSAAVFCWTATGT